MSKKITAVIMQPTYLPWLGYFDLMEQSDVFVFLDSVQFAKRSWQQRNRIRTPRGLQWLTVPAKVKGRYQQLISEVEIADESSFPQSHLRAIELNYARAPFFSRYFPELKKILDTAGNSLLDLNQHLIIWLSQEFNISAEVRTSSSLGVKGKRSELIANACLELGASTYLSTMGAAKYLLMEYDYFKKSGISVMIHNYEHPQYRQVFDPFVPYASAIDLLFNEGSNSGKIIRSGRGKSFNIEDVST